VNEAFLHYLWQFQYFNKENLATTDGDRLEVFNPGILNKHGGPDFSDATISRDALEWRGSIEIHVKASSWFDHNHQTDAAYDKVILHVVWENDVPVYYRDGTPLPTLELKNRVDLSLLARYRKLEQSVEQVPCAASWREVPAVYKVNMLDRVVTERLEHKSAEVLELLALNQNDWDTTGYQLLMRSFGFKVNNEPMMRLARIVPYKLIAKHRDQPLQVEALLFGAAGFLEGVRQDEHTRILVREYTLLRRKYNLAGHELHQAHWQFHRMRPSNFPTLRLAQAITLLISQAGIVSRMLEARSFQEIKSIFTFEHPVYWRHHYHFGKTVRKEVPGIGESSVVNLLINAAVPLMAAYGFSRHEQEYIDRAAEILQRLPAEDNNIVRRWKDLSWEAGAAFDSQGMIQWYQYYCARRKCLACSVGSVLLRPS
jgi:hypothetical protein